MNKETFWQLIDSVNASVPSGDQDAILKATNEQLSQLPSLEIARWYKMYTSVVSQADRDDLWRACCDCGIHASDDGFYYFRAWLVSRGQAVYSAVLSDPNTLSSYVTDPDEASFERFNYVSWGAYSHKACEEKLGKEGLESYYRKWVSENIDRVRSAFVRPGETREMCSRRLFRYHLEDKFDIFATVENLPSFDAQVRAAAEKATAIENGKETKPPVSEPEL